MANFPALTPATRSYSLGEITADEQAWLSGLDVISEFVGVPVAHRLQLSFPAMPSADRALLEAHYAGQQGPLYPFDLPADAWCGHANHSAIDAGLTWRYAGPLDITDADARQADVTVTLLALRDSTPLLTANVSPWYGSAVPLVATGDPAPAVPRPAMSTPGLRSLSETVPTRPPAPTPTTGTAATSDPGAPGPGGALGQTEPLPLTPVPSTEPSLTVAGGRSPEVGEVMVYKPQCTTKNVQLIQWFSQRGDLITELAVGVANFAVGGGAEVINSDPTQVVKTTYFVVETCPNGEQHVSNKIEQKPRSDDKPIEYFWRRGSRVQRTDGNSWQANTRADGVWWSDDVFGCNRKPPYYKNGVIYKWADNFGMYINDVQGPDVVSMQLTEVRKDGSTTSKFQITEVTLPDGSTGQEWQLSYP